MSLDPDNTHSNPALFDDWFDEECASVPNATEAASLAISTASVPALTALNSTPATPMAPIPFPHRKFLEHFPAFMARSALFRVGRGHSVQPTSWEVKSPGGYELTVSGPRLSMRDKLVWEVAIQIAKLSTDDMGQAFEVSLSDFADRMGLADRSGKTLNSIWDHLNRLCQARLAFRLPSGHQGTGALLATAIKQGSSFYLRVNADFALPAFTQDKQFLIQSSRRTKLTSTLAQWMHDFLSTHSTEYDLTLFHLRDFCGYDGETKKFPRLLREALDELAAKVPELVSGFEIIGKERCSDRWIVKIGRGSETPKFIMPASSNTRASSSNGHTPKSKGLPRRNGGVVL